VGKPKERDLWADPDVEGGIRVRWIFRKGDEAVWTGSSWYKKRKLAGTVNTIMMFRVP
jgi:hypothetical protein